MTQFLQWLLDYMLRLIEITQITSNSKLFKLILPILFGVFLDAKTQIQTFITYPSASKLSANPSLKPITMRGRWHLKIMKRCKPFFQLKTRYRLKYNNILDIHSIILYDTFDLLFPILFNSYIFILATIFIFSIIEENIFFIFHLVLSDKNEQKSKMNLNIKWKKKLEHIFKCALVCVTVFKFFLSKFLSLK